MGLYLLRCCHGKALTEAVQDSISGSKWFISPIGNPHGFDSHLIFVEGIVPKTRSPGSKFRIACQVHIFVRVKAFELVKSAISRGRLVLISDAGASFALSEAVVVKERKGGKEVRSVDEIFKLANKNVGKNAKMEALEPPGEVIKSVLFEHYKEGLGWLVHRQNSGELPLFWEDRDGKYVNVFTNHHTNKRAEPLWDFHR
ncbi:hypothetical protein ACJRO7_014967 [Eucalyptus globulus]|uniref:Uncharacterized protein n=1 Tax=Eucalyptus globulus TaxID=34317 RepID=A0ABD3L202_EUCGL